MSKKIEEKTGDLFGRLFPAYDELSYLRSMELFPKRLKANRFPLKWFQDKVCLDAGCGNGRYSIALSLMGARKVFGIDISKEAIKDARRRAENLNILNVKFKVASIEILPFVDKYFDTVICSGVLHHTLCPEKAMAEISRVLRPGGLLYILLYATGGIRWPLVQILRNLAKQIGFKALDLALSSAGLAVNKRRTYLDDLFVPIIDFYTWERCRNMLQKYGFEKIKRWDKGRFDHEESLDAYQADLEGFKLLFKSGTGSSIAKLRQHRKLFYAGERICSACIDYVSKMRDAVKRGRISNKEARRIVIGQGHHRIIAWKSR